MKLFDRSRMPLTEKFGEVLSVPALPPTAKFDCPDDNWLTPGTLSARLRMFLLGVSGTSAIRLGMEIGADFRIGRVDQQRICRHTYGFDRAAELQGDIEISRLIESQHDRPPHILCKTLFGNGNFIGPGRQ
jgi:hypothetical protein